MIVMKRKYMWNVVSFFRYNGSEENALYLVKGILFQECKDLERYLNIKDDIWQWEDGKYYKRVLLDSEKKLKRRNLELKKRNLELKKKPWMGKEKPWIGKEKPWIGK